MQGFHDRNKTKYCFENHENYQTVIKNLIDRYTLDNHLITQMVIVNWRYLLDYLFNVKNYNVMIESPQRNIVLGLINYIKLTEANMEAACKIKFIEIIHYLLDNNVVVNNKTLNYIIGNYHTETVKILLDKNLYKLELLILSCSYALTSMMEMILNYKIIPTKECFNALINSKNIRNDVFNTAFELLSAYGYKLTQDDVFTMIKNNIALDNLIDYQITFDKTFIKKIVEIETINEYPKFYKLIEHVQPDIECLQLACSYDNYHLISYILSKGVKADQKCILNLTETIGNSSMKLLIKNFLDIPESEIPNESKKFKKIKMELNSSDEDNTDKKAAEEDIDHDGYLNKDDIIKLQITNNFDLTNKTRRYELDDRMRRLLKIKETSMSFLEIRKTLMKFLKTNCLMHNNFIKIDARFSEVIKLESTKFINIRDLDKLTIMCFKT